MNVTGELERLLETLGGAVDSVLREREATKEGNAAPVVRSASGAKAVAGGDVIDRILASADRRTAVVSLRESPVVQAFADELTDGLIRVDTANRLLGLVNEIVTRLL